MCWLWERNVAVRAQFYAERHLAQSIFHVMLVHTNTKSYLNEEHTFAVQKAFVCDCRAVYKGESLRIEIKDTLNDRLLFSVRELMLCVTSVVNKETTSTPST
jgi:hypothetical protein